MPAPDASLPDGQSARRRRVLIVDDDVLLGRTMQRLLEPTFVVETEREPAVALARIGRGERFDAILCDLMMPGLSGGEFASRLTEIAPHLAARCGFVTGGAASDRTEAFCRTIPSERILTKPFAIDDLLALVERLLAA